MPDDICVGCGAHVPRGAGPVHPYITAAPGCWAAYGALTARVLTDRALASQRQLCVDAYAVQHPGNGDPRAVQSVGLHLVSLHAQLALGLPAGTAVRLLQRGARRHDLIFELPPPSFRGIATVVDVLEHRDRLARAIREWAAGAFGAWADHHDAVGRWYDAICGRHPASQESRPGMPTPCAAMDSGAARGRRANGADARLTPE